MLNGIIVVYKEKGFTSHDVVAKLRGILKQRKIGHTGTLDPEAEGVLPICLGKGTKVSSILTDTDKEYVATLTLGVSTDTQDHTGNVIKTNNVTVSEDIIEKAIKSFVGEYDQIPPMYSALKVNGKKLYQLAREGKEVVRKSRKVNIYSIDIIKHIDSKNVLIKINCSKGTYIRTLCNDIGERLGCGGHMSSLERTKVGIFDINSSFKLEEINNLNQENKLKNYIQPIDSLFDYKKAIVLKGNEKYVYNGNKIKENWLKIDYELVNNELLKIYDEYDRFIGIYKYIEEDKLVKPVKFFFEESE